MTNFTLTKKIQVEARAMCAAELSARTNVAAALLGAWTRAQHDADQHARAMVGANVVAALEARGMRADWTAIAVAIGESYHSHVEMVYTSQYASVSYGSGGQDREKYLYAKSYKHPARWHDAGACWTLVDGRPVLAIENSRGKDIVTIPMPRSMASIGVDGCTHGDAYSTTVTTTVRRRYDADGRVTGVAMRLPTPGRSTAQYWEHGIDVDTCRAEHARKTHLVVNAAQIRMADSLMLDDQRAATCHRIARTERRDRLLARISTAVLVHRADAVATGSCQAGIAGWCARVGITGDTAPARDVVRLAAETNERRAMAAAMHAVRHALQSRVAA